MARVSLQPMEKVRDRVATKVVSRLYFVDHLRAALITLVVLHHVALVYGASAPFYYVDPPPERSLVGLAFLLFALFNQAWFMGAFFLLAGYFTPGSLARKGAGSFLRDRLLRLGIPLLLFMFVLGPISAIGLFLDPAPLIAEPLTWQSFWRIYPELIGLGPLWFAAMLLVFSFGYAGWQMLAGNETRSPRGSSTLPSYRNIGIFVAALALATYLIRIIIPLGKTVLDFPTLAYLPQYLSFFIVGTIAYRYDWFRTVPGSMGRVGIWTAVAATLLLFPIPILGILGGTFRFLGNGSWPSAVYALWDSVFAVGMSLAALAFFGRFFNEQSTVGTFLSQQSYAVYILHSPIVVFLAYALYLAFAAWGIDPGSVLKFGIAAVVVVPACFAVAYLMRRIPGVARIV